MYFFLCKKLSSMRGYYANSTRAESPSNIITTTPLTYISFCNPFHWIYFSRSMPFLCVNFWGFNFSHFKVHIFIRLRFYGLFVFNVNVDSMNVWIYTENVVAKIKLVRKRRRPYRKEFLPANIAMKRYR